MKTIQADLNTPKGIRAAADELAAMAEHAGSLSPRALLVDNPAPVTITAGRFTARIHDCWESLRDAAVLFRKRASRAGGKKRGRWMTPTVRVPVHTEDGIDSLDAVRVYGDPETALQAIERQLAAQGADMEPADVRRCERAADEIRQHLEKQERLRVVRELFRERELEDAREIETAKRGKLEPGARVIVDYQFRQYRGEVVSAEKAGACEVSLSEIRQTEIVERERFLLFRAIKPRRARVACSNVRITN